MRERWGLALIFLTGAVVLSLEVLSSRIMTPYFGVSLYIWTGILSITLTFLAVGYHLGGKITKRLDAAAQAEIFLLLPVISAASISVSSAIFPFGFPSLAQSGLVVGSFIASGVLLALPLVCLSAMNPLLISLRSKDSATGDGGAGDVFFVSTAGSVVGVLATAFMIIPNLTNFSALFWLALTLCVAVAVPVLRHPSLGRRRKRLILIGSLAVGIVSGIFIANQNRYLDLLSIFQKSGPRVVFLEEFSSVFGNIKVVDLISEDDRLVPIRAYLQDGIIQNRTTGDNISVSMYTYVLDQLAGAFVPHAKSALVLGLGAGIVPRDLYRRNIDVTVVDINADALEAATKYFGFKRDHIAIHIQDARTFVLNCEQSYDVIVVDLFQGDSTPDYLLTSEFFSTLRRCIRPRGAMVMNAFFDPVNMEPNRRLLATIASAFSPLFEFHLADANSFVVGMAGPPPDDISFFLETVPSILVGMVGRSLESGKLITPEMLLGYEPVTDRQNIFSLLIANAQMRMRSSIVSSMPPRILVN